MLPHSVSITYINIAPINVASVTGMPHSVAKDDIYHGMLIPKGSMICVNLWCVSGLCYKIIIN